MSVVLDLTIYIDSFSFLISWTDSGMMAVDVALYRVGGSFVGSLRFEGHRKSVQVPQGAAWSPALSSTSSLSNVNCIHKSTISAHIAYANFE